FKKLGRFITDNPDIKITPSVTRIPQQLRSDYFLLFEKVRTSFVMERHTEKLEKANVLLKNYQNEKEQLAAQLNLNEIKQDGPLELFLDDPMSSFIQSIHTAGLELLKGLIDEDGFEETCDAKLTDHFTRLYNSGYNRWIMLVLLRLLGGTSSYHVELEDATDEEALGDAGFIGRYAPSPKSSASIMFKRPVEVKFIVPDLIFHSSVAEKFISFRSEVKRALVVATNQSEKFEWLPIKSVGEIEPGVTLLYSSKNRDDLRLVSDKLSIARPEIIIQTVALAEEYTPEKFHQTQSLHEKLSPASGTFLLFNGQVPSFVFDVKIEEETAPVNPNIPTINTGVIGLSIGFNQNELKPVLDRLEPAVKDSPQAEPETPV
ncbi:MAG: hypothetical protein PHI10_06850, partial [Dehalococcoidales bacterium]|nr:hypothetical protein [Dehalococcoidales bacterium]